MPLVDLTHNEVSTILYYIEGGIQGENLSKESEEEIDSIFSKLENLNWEET
tara:strand:+ start:2201 stop:2353 length:153 start_codon:yes stop_codon:yes gene_type:complete